MADDATSMAVQYAVDFDGHSHEYLTMGEAYIEAGELAGTPTSSTRFELAWRTGLRGCQRGCGLLRSATWLGNVPVEGGNPDSA